MGRLADGQMGGFHVIPCHLQPRGGSFTLPSCPAYNSFVIQSPTT